MQTSLFSADGGRRCQKARVALPILARCAKAGKTIYYSDLAKDIGAHSRSLGSILAVIGTTLTELGVAWNDYIPHIQWIVVSKANGLPGNGIGLIVDGARAYRDLSVTQKRALIEPEWDKIFAYQRWDMVLKAVGARGSTASASVGERSVL